MLIIGAGRGGGNVADLLARAGHRVFAIMDADELKRENLPHHRLGSEWIGHNKSEALAGYLAQTYDADVTFACARFDFRLLEQAHPIAQMIYGQDLILSLTDDPLTQRAVAVTAANLEIPFIAAGVSADGGGEVFAQLDVDRDTCFGCFTNHRHLAGARGALRGRDLRPGAGQQVDQWVAEVALAILEPGSSRAASVFAPSSRVGIRTAWEIPPVGRGGPRPIAVRRNPACPVCGTAARAFRGHQTAPRQPPQIRAAHALPAPSSQQPSHALFAGAAGASVLALAAAAFGLFLAHPGSGHWIFFHHLVAWALRTSREVAVPAAAASLAMLVTDAVLIARGVARRWTPALCYAQFLTAVVASAPVVVLVALAAVTVAIWAAIAAAVVALCLMLLAGG